MILIIMAVTDSSALHKFLFNVTAFINETQFFMNDNSNFIKNPLSIYKYVHSSCIKLRAPPSREAYLYIYCLSHDCDPNLIGYFLTGISIMYGSAAVMHILIFITLWQLYMDNMHMKHHPLLKIIRTVNTTPWYWIDYPN